MKNQILLLIFFLSPCTVFPTEIDLRTAERLALESSKQIINIRGQIELAVLNNKLDLRNFLPSLDINYSSGRQVNLYSADSDTIQLGFNISQPVFDGGRALKKLNLSEIQIGLQASNLKLQIEGLRDNVWQLFYGLLLNKEKLLLQKELLEISIEQLTIASRKLQMGALTELDYLEAAVEVQNLELDILDTQAEEDTYTKDFAVLLGFDHRYFEDNPLKLTGTIEREYPGMQLWEDNYKTYEGIAAVENLELNQKEAELYRLKTEYDIMQTSFIPNISLVASFYLRGTRFPLQEPGSSCSLKFEFPFVAMPAGINIGLSTDSGQQISSSAGSNASIFPDSGFIVDQKTSELNLQQASEDLKDSITALSRSIRSSLKQLEHMRLRMTIRRNTQDLLKRRLQIIETRSSMGEVSELDLMKARIDFYEEEISIREGVLELLNSERKFEKLIGADFGELRMLSNSIHLNSDIFNKER